MMSETILSDRELKEFEANEIVLLNLRGGTQRPEDVAIIDHQHINDQNMLCDISLSEHQTQTALRSEPETRTQTPEDVAITDHQQINDQNMSEISLRDDQTDEGADGHGGSASGTQKHHWPSASQS